LFPYRGRIAKERLKSPRARLFVALDLPDPIRDGLAAWQLRALTDPVLRPVKPEALHVTLCFLSYHPEKAIGRILQLIEAVEPRPAGMLLEPQPVPIPGGRPRLFAIGAVSEAAEAIQAELSDTLEAERFYKPEKRPFWPHLTVARVRSERRRPAKGERRGRSRPKRVSKRPGALPDALTEPFGAVRVALYRSNLKPQGAEYMRLGGVDLPSP
jgi:RNA 2',3'-cyclic 3'-phosphodiesterase